MKICKVCKTENEEQFIYCKNCGAQLEITPPPVPVAQVTSPAAPVPPPPVAGTNPYAGVQYNPYAPATPVSPATTPSGLVAVEMILPNPANPEYRCPQTVYVTPAQKAAIQYDILKNGGKI